MSGPTPAARSLTPTAAVAAALLLGAVTAVAVTACDGEAEATPRLDPTDPLAAEQLVVRHDFGTVPHGEAREHTFELDVPGRLGPGWVPLACNADCSCARTRMTIRGADGSQRPLGYEPMAPGEVLLVHLQLDTAKKEPVDLAAVDSRALVILQPVAATDARGRCQWPLRFRFAIDSPVRLRPCAVLDYQRVPASTTPELTLALQSDVEGRPIRFGPATCADPRVRIELETGESGALLRARFTPDGRLGGFGALVVVDTDFDGYRVQIAATGKVVPDLEAVPMPKLSLSADLGAAQAPDDPRVARQWLLVSDHDLSRPAEFQVARIVDARGRDASGSFEVRFEPLDGQPRTHRMFVRYLGGQTGEFRGQLVLAKDPDDGPYLPIELVALHLPPP